jgi:hypothetical protein
MGAVVFLATKEALVTKVFGYVTLGYIDILVQNFSMMVL